MGDKERAKRILALSKDLPKRWADEQARQETAMRRIRSEAEKRREKEVRHAFSGTDVLETFEALCEKKGWTYKLGYINSYNTANAALTLRDHLRYEGSDDYIPSGIFLNAEVTKKKLFGKKIILFTSGGGHSDSVDSGKREVGKDGNLEDIIAELISPYV